MRAKIVKKYYNYKLWEDYQNGMFRHIKMMEDEMLLKKKAKELLSNEVELYRVMRGVIDCWIISSLENMTDRQCNRKSWLGQSACCFIAGVPEYITREAWKELDDQTQNKANAVAARVISEWEEEYTKGMKQCS